MKEDFIKECQDNFNKVGLYGGSYPVRVIGFCEDERDYYYIVKLSGGEVHYYSMVGGFDSLDPEVATYTYRNWENNSPPEKEFIIQVHSDDKEDDEYFSD